MNMKRYGVTLVVLLIVVSIIMILAARLLQALNKARARSLQSSCNGNQKQIMAAVLLYATDFNDRTPPLNLATSFSGTNPTRNKNWWSNLLVRGGYLPAPKVWQSENEGKSGTGVLICPLTSADNRTIGIYSSTTYGVSYNHSLMLSRIREVSTRTLIGDTRGSISFYPAKNAAWVNEAPQSFDPRHEGGAIGGFLDGHTEFRRYSSWLAADRDCFGR